MPYIKKEDRAKFDSAIYTLIEDLKTSGFNEGEMNYIFSKISNAAFNASPRYSTANKVMGVLECVKSEFYRRKAANLEDKKILENGDI